MNDCFLYIQRQGFGENSNKNNTYTSHQKERVLGHLMRNEGMENLIPTGEIEGKREIGK